MSKLETTEVYYKMRGGTIPPTSLDEKLMEDARFKAKEAVNVRFVR
jgi:hypothetical protein